MAVSPGDLYVCKIVSQPNVKRITNTTFIPIVETLKSALPMIVLNRLFIHEEERNLDKCTTQGIPNARRGNTLKFPDQSGVCEPKPDKPETLRG